MKKKYVFRDTHLYNTLVYQTEKVLTSRERTIRMTSLKDTRILLVDDEEQILNFVKYVLDKEGCIVSTAENGKEAMVQFSMAEFDVVVTDIAMPVQDGIDTIIEMRQLSPSVAIVAMSGVSANEKLLRLASEFEADVTIKKPFTVEEIVAAVKDAKEKKKQPE